MFCFRCPFKKYTFKTKLAYVGRLQCREYKYYTILQASVLVPSPFSVVLIFFSCRSLQDGNASTHPHFSVLSPLTETEVVY